MMTNEKVFVYDQEDIKAILESVVKESLTVQKPLSDEAIGKIVDVWTSEYQHTIIDFARAIEKHHGIG